jgi:hypothetical protein
VSIRRKVLLVLHSIHQRLIRVEDDADRNGAVLHRNEIVLARIEQRLVERFDRLERALVEQGRTLSQSLTRYTEQQSRIGQEFHRHEETLFNHEGRIGHLEKAISNGAE